MGDLTDQLMDLVASVQAPDADYQSTLHALQEHQHTLIDALVENGASGTVRQHIDRDVQEIDDLMRAMRLLRTVPDTAQDLIAGYGELWSARLLGAHLRARGLDVAVLDARDALVVEAGRMGPTVQWAATRERFNQWRCAQAADVFVITGYVASTPDGAPTTLGRNGSDFSASIFASLLEASELHIWTDVDGVMSADPRHVPDARRLETLSYHEAMELAYFGAKVIHPSTLAPAFERQIPIYIRNTFHADRPGTRIHLDSSKDRIVKGFATIDDIALINIEGSGMIGVPGVARRLFDALENAGVSVIMISQGSSEHSICFAVPAQHAQRAQEAAHAAFHTEIQQSRIQSVEVAEDCSILAVVGDRMAGTPGVASTFFRALGAANVNVRAIAQGSSERNISVVVSGKDATRALRAAHAGFYLSNHTLSVGIIGPGNVGTALLDQIAAQRDHLQEENGIDIRVRGIVNTQRMLLDEKHINLRTWRHALQEASHAPDLDALVDHIRTDYHPHAVLIDCTSSQEVADHYPAWLERGIHVITPNKKANTSGQDVYRALRRSSRGPGPQYLYETTVGAGLPIIQTLRNLIETGDRVEHIEGILSGTLSYLFNAFDGERAFSDILREAKANGFTEPDPRDDLSGMDVARKIVILGREIGLDLSLDDVTVESLVPEGLDAGSVDDFLDRLAEYDDRMTAILREAREHNQVLRFVGSVDRSGEASVKLRRYDADHSFARINHTDNIVQFRTQRYNTNPLVVQGPGAGPEVTAAGVFADLLRVPS
jgi:aspartokinase/homoserine dehydrogenase 1